jgi:hypothetical protein
LSGGITGEGRPLRVMLLLGLGLGVWVMLRLPMLERDLQATRQDLAGESDTPEAATRSPLTLASVTTAQASGDTVAIAEAEVDVAAAELALAQARLRLARVRRSRIV